jgi:hypothetical protein
MSKRKDKATRLVDAFQRATERKAVQTMVPPEVREQIEEDFAKTRFALQYFISTLIQKAKTNAKTSPPSE